MKVSEKAELIEEKTIYEFDHFRVDPVNRLLFRDDEIIPLTARVFDILLVFIENSGRLLQKEEVMQRVWQDSFVEEGNLTRNVSTLRKALGEDPKSHQYIVTVPGHGYKFVARVREVREVVPQSILAEQTISTTVIEEEISLPDLTNAVRVPGGTSENAATRPRTWIKNRKAIFLIVAACLAGITLAVVLLIRSTPILSRSSELRQSPLIARPLTTDPGFEGMPSLSPDGNYVAFIAGGGEQQKDYDLYVKQIGGGSPLRLTSGPAVEEFPAWSPDGRLIAFVRPKGDKLDVVLIPSLGGPERKVAEVAAPAFQSIFSIHSPCLSWSADSKYLVTADRMSSGEPPGLVALSVVTGEKRELTRPPQAQNDGNPAVSPDGRTLAFARVIAIGRPQLYVLPLTDDCRPAGEARRLEVPQPWVTSPTWTSDGREIVCSAGEPWGGHCRLWRVPVSGSENPQPLASVGEGALQPTISRQGNRLVYADWRYDPNIWRAEISGPGRNSPAVKLIASTYLDNDPQYSPDGSKIVFGSGRSGNGEIWMCDSDGSSPVQLTSLESNSGSPRWFPDGRRIVFDCNNEGHVDIFVIDTESRVPRRLTDSTSDRARPSVSHDGKWIYFEATRTGRLEIWRMPSEGGEPVQVTREGGMMPFESVDGEVIYYLKQTSETVFEVWKVPVSGGVETKVVGPAGEFRVAFMGDGIYITQVGTRVFVGSRGNSLKFFSFARGTAEKVCDIKYSLDFPGLSVSPDGRYALMTLVDPEVYDLMLVENFH